MTQRADQQSAMETKIRAVYDEHKGRHNIRKLMSGKKLTEETKAAAKAEKDRRDRVEKEHSKVSLHS